MDSNNNDSRSATNPPSFFQKMFAEHTITQHRFIMVVLLLAMATLAGWQQANSNSTTSVQKFSVTPLSKEIAALNFAVAESSWSDLQFDEQGNLLINSQTDPALTDAIILVQNQNTGLETKRLETLLEKQYGDDKSQKILALFYPLKNYKDIEQQWWRENGNQIPPPHEELFQLQNEVLGEELATKLFAEQRRIARMMLASYEIRNDNTLSQEEKERALAELQSGFQNGFEQGQANDAGF